LQQQDHASTKQCRGKRNGELIQQHYMFGLRRAALNNLTAAKANTALSAQ
jgi:hypothetical protein